MPTALTRPIGVCVTVPTWESVGYGLPVDHPDIPHLMKTGTSVFVDAVYMMADAYTIIRHGEKIGTYQRGELSENDIADLITGQRER